LVGGVDVVGGGVFLGGGPDWVVTVGGVVAGGVDGGGLSVVTGGGALVVVVGGGLEGVSGGGVFVGGGVFPGGGVFSGGGFSPFLPPWSFPLPLSFPPCSDGGVLSVVEGPLSLLPFPPPANADAAVNPRTKAAMARITPIV
jgi:hypothetical protein